jgi:hypothetical protein
MALHSTSGQNGYLTQTMYNVLEGDNNTDKDTVTTITQTAAATTTMGTTPTGTPAVNADITAAINQLLANQAAIMSQMAALLSAQAPAQHTCQCLPCNMFKIPGAAHPAGGHPHAATFFDRRFQFRAWETSWGSRPWTRKRRTRL